jgi:mannose-6-phosphate isomerase-like protein (cupin superfamily)
MLLPDTRILPVNPFFKGGLFLCPAHALSVRMCDLPARSIHMQGAIRSVFMGSLIFLGAASAARSETDAQVLRPSEVMRRSPDIEGPNVRVWTMRRSDVSRTNLVEMKGELAYHRHPDAEHTLLVLEGRICAWYGEGENVTVAVLGPGDYISIAKNVPHKYKTITKTALLLSFDAPYYKESIDVSEEHASFPPCPAEK